MNINFVDNEWLAVRFYSVVIIFFERLLVRFRGLEFGIFRKNRQQKAACLFIHLAQAV